MTKKKKGPSESCSSFSMRIVPKGPKINSLVQAKDSTQAGNAIPLNLA